MTQVAQQILPPNKHVGVCIDGPSILPCAPSFEADGIAKAGTLAMYLS